MLGGYRVLAADFHTHSSTWSDGALTPWGMVIDARYQGLDAIAITGHRQTLDAKWGRWFSERIGGPIVLVGEELPEIPHHVIAVGIHTTVDSALPIGAQIDEIHRQGGIAIAAHPGEFFWQGVRAGDGSARRHRNLSPGYHSITPIRSGARGVRAACRCGGDRLVRLSRTRTARHVPDVRLCAPGKRGRHPRSHPREADGRLRAR